jgi:hypothetical protein
VAYWLRHYATSRKVYLILPTTIGLEVYSQPYRNEYEKQENNVSGK